MGERVSVLERERVKERVGERKCVCVGERECVCGRQSVGESVCEGERE